MTEPEALDPTALTDLADMTGGDPTFLAEMLGIYVTDTAQLLTTMREALASGNADELRRAAHSLKSNSATFGARILANLCQELEIRAKSGDLTGVDVLLNQVATEFARAERALHIALPAM